MARFGRFTLRVNKLEQQMIALLSQRLQRSQSDAVRLIIRVAATEVLLKEDVADQAVPTEPVSEG